MVQEMPQAIQVKLTQNMEVSWYCTSELEKLKSVPGRGRPGALPQGTSSCHLTKPCLSLCLPHSQPATLSPSRLMGPNTNRGPRYTPGLLYFQPPLYDETEAGETMIPDISPSRGPLNSLYRCRNGGSWGDHDSRYSS